MSGHQHDFMTTMKESSLILMFELLGSALLGSLFTCCYVSGDFTGLFCGFFILLIFSARISGSHFNPAVTLAFMMRKDTGRFNRVLGILYIVFQYAGAFLGVLLSWTILGANKISLAVPPLTVLQHTSDSGFLQFLQGSTMELLGVMLIVFLYLTQTEEKTKISSDPAITTLIIAGTFFGVVGFSESSGVITGSPFNPALSFGLFWNILFTGDVKQTNMVFLFLFMGYAGAILSVLLFELVYKPSVTKVQEVEDDQNSDEGMMNESPGNDNDQALLKNDY